MADQPPTIYDIEPDFFLAFHHIQLSDHEGEK